MSQEWYDTEAELFASTEGSRGEGAYWLGGRSEYIEAASGATDHDVTTAGGVKLYVSIASGKVSVDQWGVFPTNTAAANTAALNAMRNRLRALDNNRLWEVTFPASSTTYQYDSPYWVRGIKKLRLVGYGASLQNTAVASRSIGRVPWAQSNLFQAHGDGDPGFDIFELGDDVQNAGVGDASVTLKTIANAAGYSEGDRVLIMSWDTQGQAFPPNMKNFQFLECASDGVAGTGVVAFTQQLSYDYRDDHPHQTSGTWVNAGRARIINLDRGMSDVVHPEIFEALGITIRVNPNYLSGVGVNLMASDYVRWKDIKVADGRLFLWPSLAHNAFIENVAPVGAGIVDAEFDKIVEYAEVRDSKFTGSNGGGTGVRRTLFENNHFSGSEWGYSPLEQVKYKSNVFAMNSSAAFGVIKQSVRFGQGRCELEDNRFQVDQSADLEFLVNTLVSTNFSPASMPSDEEMVFSVSGWPNIAQAIRVGSILCESNMENIGEVTAISQSGSDITATISWSRKNAPTAADTFQLISPAPVVDLGGNSTNIEATLARLEKAYFTQGPLKDGNRGTLALSLSDFNTFRKISQTPFILEKLTIDVVRPYTGADWTKALLLSFESTFSSSPTVTVSIDLKTAGRREITPYDASIEATDSNGINQEWWAGLSSNLTSLNIGAGFQRPVANVRIDYVLPRFDTAKMGY